MTMASNSRKTSPKIVGKQEQWDQMFALSCQANALAHALTADVDEGIPSDDRLTLGYMLLEKTSALKAAFEEQGGLAEAQP